MKKALTYRNTMRACYQGGISQAIINNLAPLLFAVFQNRFGISFSMIGFLIMLNFGTQLIVDAISVRIADNIGHRPLIVFAHICCTLGLWMLAVLPGVFASPYAGLCVAVVVYAIGGGLIEVLVSPIADALPMGEKSSAMVLMHSFYCWGFVAVVLGTTLLLNLLGTDRWAVLPFVWSIVPLLNAINFARVPLAPTLSAHERLPLSQLLSNKIFLLAILMMICSGAAEQSMSQWASFFAEKGLGISKTMGDLLGPCLFAVLMGIGRTLYGVYGERVRLSRVLVICALLCIACYLLTSLAKSPIIALISCAVTGFSVSLMWPGMISLSARMFHAGGTALFGLLAMGGDIGCALGPWITGLVSGAVESSDTVLAWFQRGGQEAAQAGLRAGLLAATLFPTILLAGLLLLRRARAGKGHDQH